MSKKQKGSAKGRKKLRDNYYFVDQVLAQKRREDGQVMVLVSWKGYPQSQNSWVFRNTLMTLGEYLKTHNNSNSVCDGEKVLKK